MKGLRLVPEVHLLLRLNFLEFARRADILDSGNLRSIRPFVNRLPMMHRAGWTGLVAAGFAMAIAVTGIIKARLK